MKDNLSAILDAADKGQTVSIIRGQVTYELVRKHGMKANKLDRLIAGIKARQTTHLKSQLKRKHWPKGWNPVEEEARNGR